MLEKVKAFANKHKDTAFKVAMIGAGVAVGVVIMVILTVTPEEPIEDPASIDKPISEFTSLDENGNMIYNPFEDPASSVYPS